MRLLKTFFTIIYFLIFCVLIDLVFRNTLSVITDLLAIMCWFIAFIMSVGLAGYTVDKIKGNIENK